VGDILYIMNILPKELINIIFEYSREYSFLDEYNKIVKHKLYKQLKSDKYKHINKTFIFKYINYKNGGIYRVLKGDYTYYFSVRNNQRYRLNFVGISEFTPYIGWKIELIIKKRKIYNFTVKLNNGIKYCG
jgi:hypothetical protein